MSGEHRDLIEAVLPDVDKEIRHVMEQSLWILLGDQYVQHSDLIFQVMDGTGMGKPHSGALADAAFWVRCEASLSFESLGVLCYARFRDDLLVVAKDAEHSSAFTNLLQKRAAPIWNLEVDRPDGFRFPSWIFAFTKVPDTSSTEF